MAKTPKKTERPKPMTSKVSVTRICKYYGVEEDTEKASYLIDYIIQKMHRVFRSMINTSTI